MKQYVLISDFCLSAKNRGTGALGYGALSFLRERVYIDNNHLITTIKLCKNPFKRSIIWKENVQGEETTFCTLYVDLLEYYLFYRFGIKVSFLPFGRFLNNLDMVAAINGGDGFSDIYGTMLFNSRLTYSHIAIKNHTPLVLLPQTIGPFEDKKNIEVATNILKYAKKVYVRDYNYTKELESLGIEYEVTKDLSSYMRPEPWDINIEPNAVGINISGLAYSNKFFDLAGQFDAYPDLIRRLVYLFRDLGHPVYIIPHAYGYDDPEENNDDYVSSSEFYNSLSDKQNVYFINQNLKSPQVKYVISKMSFFIGTRMHANFAAIYTGVPVFGLSYSYKFDGAFNANGLDAQKQTARINNIKTSDIDKIVEKITAFYKTISHE